MSDLSDCNYYYLVSFATEVNVEDFRNPKAEIKLEHFHFMGTSVDQFEYMMGKEDALKPIPLNEMRLARRMNPQRHIKIYGIRVNVEEELWRMYCEYSPEDAFQKCIDHGVEL